MNTAQLINSLSPRKTGKLTPSLIVGGAGLLSAVAVLALSMLWLKPRSDLHLELAAENHIFMLKVVFTICVVIATLPLIRSFSVPGRKIGWGGVLLAAPFAIIILLGVADLAFHPAASVTDAAQHASRFDCLWQIPALAIPAFFIIAAGVRYLAPTNLLAAGALIGLVAGAIGAAGYAFHCHDDSVAFVAFAYTLAIAETAVLGALAGPRLLRWS